jgi:hypothetical protein
MQRGWLKAVAARPIGQAGKLASGAERARRRSGVGWADAAGRRKKRKITVM